MSSAVATTLPVLESPSEILHVLQEQTASGRREQVSQWDGRHSNGGVTTPLASNVLQAESPMTCGVCALTGTLRSDVSVPGATLTSLGRPSSFNTSTVKV